MMRNSLDWKSSKQKPRQPMLRPLKKLKLQQPPRKLKRTPIRQLKPPPRPPQRRRHRRKEMRKSPLKLKRRLVKLRPPPLGRLLTRPLWHQLTRAVQSTSQLEKPSLNPLLRKPSYRFKNLTRGVLLRRELYSRSQLIQDWIRPINKWMKSLHSLQQQKLKWKLNKSFLMVCMKHNNTYSRLSKTCRVRLNSKKFLHNCKHIMMQEKRKLSKCWLCKSFKPSHMLSYSPLNKTSG